MNRPDKTTVIQSLLRCPKCNLEMLLFGTEADTSVTFGGVYAVLDYLGAEENVRTQSLVVLAAITVVNAIWRAVGALAARIELMSKTKHD